MDESDLLHVKGDGLSDSLLGSIEMEDDENAPRKPPKSVGLSRDEVNALREEHGLNEQHGDLNKKIMNYGSMLWAPVSVLMYVVIAVEVIDCHWLDVALLVVLLFVAFAWALGDKMETDSVEEMLKSTSPNKILTKRDGYFKLIDVLTLVPGDVIKFETGDIIPADIVLCEGPPVDTDQSELTGECLPVAAYPGDTILMGSIVKFGRGEGIVTATGKRTTLEKASRKFSSSYQHEHLGRIQIGLYQVSSILATLCTMCCIGIMTAMLRHKVDIPRSIGISILMLVAIIPFATNLVYHATISAAVRSLARKGIVVQKPGVFENMAGMDMLLVDKSKVITQGMPVVQESDSIAIVSGLSVESILFFAFLSIKKKDGVYAQRDPIDNAIEQAVSSRRQSLLQSSSQYEILDLQPFDPVLKYSEVTAREPTGLVIKTMKGQVKVVLSRCSASEELEHRIANAVKLLAEQNLRSIGVARTDSRTGRYEFLGILALYDPIQEDTRDWIRRSADMGVEVRLITGDHIFVSKATCRMVGIGANLVNTEFLDEGRENVARELVSRADGFADVFPDQKLTIVQMLQSQGMTCGLTGNGVEEAAAMRAATTGIALGDATPAVKAAAVIILHKPGMKDIIECIQEARKIFIRLRNFCVYRISTAIGFMFPLFFFATCFNMSDYFPGNQRSMETDNSLVSGVENGKSENSFVLPTIALVIFCILNNATIVAISKDSVFYSNIPLKWKIGRIFVLSAFSGIAMLLQNLFLFIMGVAASAGANCGDHCGQAPDDFSDEQWCEYAHPDAPADCLQAYGTNFTRGTHKCDDGFSAVFGDEEHGVLRYAELKTLMLLSLSLSVFLSAFTARTAGPFYSRWPSKYLVMVISFSSVLITLIALFCGDMGIDKRLEDLEVKTVCFVWAYTVGFFLLIVSCYRI